MNKKLYMACGVVALAVTACSDDNGVVGTSTEPNTMAFGSSSSVVENSSGSEVSVRGNLWDPVVGDYAVRTSLYASSSWPKNAIADGRWFLEMQTDAEDGGSSYISWPVELGDGTDSLAPVMQTCRGICGTAVLDKGGLTYTPFVGIGFSLAVDDSGLPIPVDVSNWEGVCISYSSEAPSSLVLDMGDSLEKELRYGLPSVALPKTEEVVSKCFKWSDFKLPVWLLDVPEYWMDDVGEKAAKRLVALEFRIQVYSGEYKFNIKSLGTLADDPAGIVSLESSSSSHIESSSATPFVLGGVDGGLWSPTKNGDHVRTSLYSMDTWPEGANESGYWFDRDDSEKGGESFIDWPVQLDDVGSLEPVFSNCKGICGTASLRKGSQSGEPSVSVGFFIALDSAWEKPVPVDVSNWGGICMEYYSEKAITIELGLGDSLNQVLGGKLPSAELPRSLSAEKICYVWSMFNLPDGMENVPEELKVGDHWQSLVGENAAKHLVSVSFKIQADEGDYKFGIGAIGAVYRGFESNLNLPLCVKNDFGKYCGEDIWEPNFGMKHVNTARYSKNDWPQGVVEDGAWFLETDGEKGGASTIAWIFPGAQIYDEMDTMEFVVAKCQGICGTASLNHGAMADDPYVTVGFNLAKNSAGKSVPVDVSVWGGMCLKYSSQVAMNLELDLGDSLNALLGAKPFITLPINETSEETCVPWENFELPSGRSALKEIGGGMDDFVARHLAAIRFVMHSSTDMENKFNIRSIGTLYDEKIFQDRE